MRCPGLAALVLGVFALAGTTEAREDPVEPRLGKYTIKSRGASTNPELLLGYFVLEKGGKYRVLLPGGREVGEGTYEYDSAKKQIVWKTGQYKEEGWGGRFYVGEDDKKTHWVQMKATTKAYNTPKDEK